MDSLFWHDYETFGSDPRRDRACQFAGIRTDLELNEIDDPVEVFCKPAADFLPDPESCLITGITPQQALATGVCEALFCERIAHELAMPGTCGVGYNSVRFDDELTRQLLYRNFHDPYEREWRNGNSRWDLIDVLRMTHALRPEGIEWPRHEDGSPSFRLELLTKANGIGHADAHDALADVRATIAMAKLVRQRQPRLYDFLFQLRSKHRVLPLLDLVKQDVVVHVSRMFPASRGCLALVMPVCRHPTNPNGIVVVDLLSDPAELLASDAGQIRHKLYTPTAALPEGAVRLPLKTVHVNRCPALAPLSVINDAVVERYQLDLALVERRRQQLRETPQLADTIASALKDDGQAATLDADVALYQGFIGDQDRRLCQQLRRTAPADLYQFEQRFKDPRLQALVFRYQARNYPETLDPAGLQRWQALCRSRLLGERAGAGVTQAEFRETLTTLRAEGREPALVQQLEEYGQQVLAACGLL